MHYWTQSDTFIVDDTVSALQIPCRPVKLSLSTMTAQHTVIESFRVCGLQVRAFKSSEHDKVSINQAYTRMLSQQTTLIFQRKVLLRTGHIFSRLLMTCHLFNHVRLDYSSAIIVRRHWRLESY